MNFRRQALNAKLTSLRYCADCKLLLARHFGWNRHLQHLHWGWWEKGLAIVIFIFEIHLPQSITVKSLANWIRILVCCYCRSFRFFFGGWGEDIVLCSVETSNVMQRSRSLISWNKTWICCCEGLISHGLAKELWKLFKSEYIIKLWSM